MCVFFTVMVGCLAAIILKKIWFVIRWRMGWRPRILNKECVEKVAIPGAANFMEQCKLLNPEAYEDVSDEQVAGMQKDMEEYTRWAIEDYVRWFCICEK